MGILVKRLEVLMKSDRRLGGRREGERWELQLERMNHWSLKCSLRGKNQAVATGVSS